MIQWLRQLICSHDYYVSQVDFNWGSERMKGYYEKPEPTWKKETCRKCGHFFSYTLIKEVK